MRGEWEGEILHNSSYMQSYYERFRNYWVQVLWPSPCRELQVWSRLWKKDEIKYWERQNGDTTQCWYMQSIQRSVVKVTPSMALLHGSMGLTQSKCLLRVSARSSMYWARVYRRCLSLVLSASLVGTLRGFWDDVRWPKTLVAWVKQWLRHYSSLLLLILQYCNYFCEEEVGSRSGLSDNISTLKVQ